MGENYTVFQCFWVLSQNFYIPMRNKSILQSFTKHLWPVGIYVFWLLPMVGQKPLRFH